MFKNFTMLCVALLFIDSKLCATKILKVCMWYDCIPASVIEKFEQEYNIKVIVDVHDDDNILEAKLVAGNSGYDLVITSAWPFIARQVKSGIYRKINKSTLSNYKNIDNVMLNKIKNSDEKNQYVIPYFWGLFAIGYNHDAVKGHLPEEKLNSWSLIFDPLLLHKTAFLGVTLIDDPIEFFSLYYLYKGEDLSNNNIELLKSVVNEVFKFKKIY